MAGLRFLISVINNGLAGRGENLKNIKHWVDILMEIQLRCDQVESVK